MLLGIIFLLTALFIFVIAQLAVAYKNEDQKIYFPASLLTAVLGAAVWMLSLYYLNG